MAQRIFLGTTGGRGVHSPGRNAFARFMLGAAFAAVLLLGCDTGENPGGDTPPPGDENPGAPALSGSFAINGTKKVGQTLSIDAAGLTNKNSAMSVTWSWTGGSVTGATLALGAAHWGKVISATVRYSGNSGNKTVSTTAIAAIEIAVTNGLSGYTVTIEDRTGEVDAALVEKIRTPSLTDMTTSYGAYLTLLANGFRVIVATSYASPTYNATTHKGTVTYGISALAAASAGTIHTALSFDLDTIRTVLMVALPEHQSVRMAAGSAAAPDAESAWHARTNAG